MEERNRLTMSDKVTIVEAGRLSVGSERYKVCLATVAMAEQAHEGSCSGRHLAGIYQTVVTLLSLLFRGA